MSKYTCYSPFSVETRSLLLGSLALEAAELLHRLLVLLALKKGRTLSGESDLQLAESVLNLV